MLSFHEKNIFSSVRKMIFFKTKTVRCYSWRQGVFRMKFRVLCREFESIETFPGFAQLLGENWV